MNFKGGSAKTTTATHLAQYLALRGYRVLAVDLDGQASMSAMLGHQPEFDVGENETIYGAIRYDDQRVDITEVIRASYLPGLHIIPGQLEVTEFEHDTPKVLADKTQAGSLFFSRIGQALAPVADVYDVVIFDCPPQLGFLTLSALCAATSVLITVHPQMMDVMSMSQFLRMTADLLRVVSDAQNQMVGFMRSMFGTRVLNNPMLKSTAISDAGLTKQTLYEIERSQFTKGTYDRALESLTAVNSEIEDLIRKAWGRV
jgi:chromosome partitioning protein